MNTTLNSVYSLYINSADRSTVEKTKVNSDDKESALFASHLENAKADTYIDDIKKIFPKTTVTVKSMTAADVQKYYEVWKKQPIDYSGLKHSIIISPKVLEKMKNDPEYAKKMLLKIKSAAIPKGFGNAKLYEYKVIVRDDGEIETFACADFMNGKNKKVNDDDEKKKKEHKKIELDYSHSVIYEQLRPQTIPGSGEDIMITQCIGPQYFLNIAAENKNRKEND